MRFIVIAALTVSVLVPCGIAQSEQVFEKELKKTQRLVARMRWRSAKKKLNLLLKVELNRPFARKRRVEIVDVIWTCAFHVAQK